MLRSPALGLAALALAFTIPSVARAQGAQARLLQPMTSPRATVGQILGITEVLVEYGRPGLAGRDVMNNPNVVPFDNPQSPWRAGANMNTVISVSHDVTVQGKSLPAGEYGVHTWPKRDAPWTIAFSKVTGAWGSYTYDPAEDVLRVEATPGEGHKTEWLSYTFEDLDSDSATLVLAWDELRLPLEIGTDTTANMLSYLRDDYTRGYGFWLAPQLTAAATWCDTNNVNLEEAASWAQRGTQSPSFTAFTTLGSIQEKLGLTSDADASYASAEQYANEAQRNALGYRQLQGGRIQKAIETFARNVEAFPASWNAHDSLAEAYTAAGEEDKAIELYTRALEMVGDDKNKARIQSTLDQLRG